MRNTHTKPKRQRFEVYPERDCGCKFHLLDRSHAAYALVSLTECWRCLVFGLFFMIQVCPNPIRRHVKNALSWRVFDSKMNTSSQRGCAAYTPYIYTRSFFLLSILIKIVSMMQSFHAREKKREPDGFIASRLICFVAEEQILISCSVLSFISYRSSFVICVFLFPHTAVLV